jgi:hypothetical protein
MSWMRWNGIPPHPDYQLVIKVAVMAKLTIRRKEKIKHYYKCIM